MRMTSTPMTRPMMLLVFMVTISYTSMTIAICIAMSGSRTSACAFQYHRLVRQSTNVARHESCAQSRLLIACPSA
jgi:hypothetical protein